MFMPEEIDGKTYYSQEEFDEHTEEKETQTTRIEELENELETTEGDKTKVQEDLDTANEDLEKLKDKDTNFKNIRKSKEDKEDENEELKTQVTDTNKKIDDLVASNRKEVLDDFEDEHGITDNKELKEKFDHYFEKVGEKATTKREILNAAREANILATQDSKQDDGVKRVAPRAGNVNNKPDEEGEKTKEQKDMQKAIGNTDEDVEKYGKDSGDLPLV